MDKIIADGEMYAFSGEDMQKLTENKYKIYTYSDLEKENNIDDVLGENLGAIILYESSKNQGHWVSMWRDKNTIFFFDSYGFNVDEDLKFSEFNLRQHKGKKVNHLTHLIDNSNYKVNVNHYKYQTLKNQNNTCGRFSGLRIRMRDETSEYFHKLLTTNKCYDAAWWVTSITGHIGENFNNL
jgi:hypothetical protein